MDNVNSRLNRQENYKVLFLGNGILRAWGENAKSGQDLEDMICGAAGSRIRIKGNTIPFPMRVAASLANSKNREQRLEDAVRKLIDNGKLSKNNQICNSGVAENPLFRLLLEAGFTDIITTNYGYEIEKVLCGKSPVSATEGSRFFKSCLSSEGFQITERKFKVYKYSPCPVGRGTVRVWHVHGEYLKPQSIIFDYADYCSLVSRINARPKLKPVENLTRGTAAVDMPKPVNWMDSFILGDVYVLGFGASWGEQDFWRLMERRRNKKHTGTLYFYEPTFNGSADEQFKKDIVEMIGAFGGEHRSMGINIAHPEKEKSKFQEFYKKAINEIVGAVNGTIDLCERN